MNSILVESINGQQLLRQAVTKIETFPKLLNHHITSLTAFKDYHFNVHNNDEGPPFDIKSCGGYLNNYSQLSQEVRLSSKTCGFFDYQAGIYLLDVRNKTEFNNIYGHDAGAWYANKAQYALLDKNNKGRLLMENSLDGLWTDTFNQDIHNQSGAIFGHTNFHFTDDLTLSVGGRFTNEHRVNPNFSDVRNNGYGSKLNPFLVNGNNLGGFTSIAGKCSRILDGSENERSVLDEDCYRESSLR